MWDIRIVKCLYRAYNGALQLGAMMRRNAIWMLLLAIQLSVSPAKGGELWNQNPDSPQESFLITGQLLGDGGRPVVGKRVWALPVDSKGDIPRSFTVAKSGLLSLASPAGVTDSSGVFAIKVGPTDIPAGQVGRRLAVLCFDPNGAGSPGTVLLVNLGPVLPRRDRVDLEGKMASTDRYMYSRRVTLVNVTNDTKNNDTAKILFSRGGISLRIPPRLNRETDSKSMAVG